MLRAINEGSHLGEREAAIHEVLIEVLVAYGHVLKWTQDPVEGRNDALDIFVDLLSHCRAAKGRADEGDASQVRAREVIQDQVPSDHPAHGISNDQVRPLAYACLGEVLRDRLG